MGNWSAASAASKLMKKALKLEALTLSLLAVLTHSYCESIFSFVFSTCANVCWCPDWLISEGKFWKMTREVFTIFYTDRQSCV